MNTSAWLALAALAAIGLVLLGAYIRLLLAETPSEREETLRSRLNALKTANLLGQEFFRAQAQMRHEAHGRASTIDGQVVDPDRNRPE